MTGLVDGEVTATATTSGHHGTEVMMKNDVKFQHHHLDVAVVASASDVVSAFQIRSESLQQISVLVRCCSSYEGTTMTMVMAVLPFLLEV